MFQWSEYNLTAFKICSQKTQSTLVFLVPSFLWFPFMCSFPVVLWNTLGKHVLNLTGKSISSLTMFHKTWKFLHVSHFIKIACCESVLNNWQGNQHHTSTCDQYFGLNMALCSQLEAYQHFFWLNWKRLALKCDTISCWSVFSFVLCCFSFWQSNPAKKGHNNLLWARVIFQHGHLHQLSMVHGFNGQTLFLVICAGYRSSSKHYGYHLPKVCVE